MNIEIVVLIIATLAVVILATLNKELRDDLKEKKGKISAYKGYIICEYDGLFYFFKNIPFVTDTIRFFCTYDYVVKYIDEIIEEEKFKRRYDKFSNGKSEIKGEGITNLYTYPEPRLKKKGGKK